jgi:PAS domain S-box-containing protein
MSGRIQQHAIKPHPLLGTRRLDQYEQIPELYLRSFIDSYSAGVAVLDEAGNILYVNKTWREVGDRTDVDNDVYRVGANYLQILRRQAGNLTSDSAIIAEGIKRVLQRTQTEFHKDYRTSNSPAGRWIRIRAGRFDLAHTARVLITQEDITDTHEVKTAREQEAERLQMLLNVTHILPWEADVPSSTFTYVGDQALEMFGYALEHWYRPGFWLSHLHPDDREQAIATHIDCTNTCDNYETDYRMLTQDGRVVWLHNLVTVIREHGRPKTIRGFSIDVTQSKQNDAALRDLSRRLINAQEEERRRVARELHDDLNQRMALLSIELAQLRQMHPPSDWNRRLEALEIQAQEISADIHRLSYKLHPSKLDHLGLRAAIKSLCQEVAAKSQIEIKLEQTGFVSKFSKDVTLCVFRIAQEALRNCVKHSSATQAHVILKNTGETIRLTVSDNGCGFDLHTDAMKKGLGFTSMRERLQILGGTMQVRSQPMQGTVIEVCVPLARGADTAPM